MKLKENDFVRKNLIITSFVQTSIKFGTAGDTHEVETRIKSNGASQESNFDKILSVITDNYRNVQATTFPDNYR